jgi:hypothetical protein
VLFCDFVVKGNRKAAADKNGSTNYGVGAAAVAAAAQGRKPVAGSGAPLARKRKAATTTAAAGGAPLRGRGGEECLREPHSDSKCNMRPR